MFRGWTAGVTTGVPLAPRVAGTNVEGRCSTTATLAPRPGPPVVPPANLRSTSTNPAEIHADFPLAPEAKC